MNFDAITPTQLRHPASLKWSAFPDAIGMFVAEMDFGLAPAVRSAIERYRDAPGIGYLPPNAVQNLQQSAATWVGRHGWNISPNQVHVAPDVLSIARAAITNLTDEGTPVIVPTPNYMAFFKVIPALGRDIISVNSLHDDDGFHLDLTGIRDAFARGAQMLVLVNPWNPTGRVLSRSELEALDAVVRDFPKARVFVDEIHAPLALTEEWIPYASISESAARQAITAIATSKGWNIPGLKCAQAIISNPDDVQAMKSSLNWLSSVVSSVGVAASTAAYASGQEWLDEVRTYIAGNLTMMHNWADATDGVSMDHVEGTYIAWLDLSGLFAKGTIPGDADLGEWFREKAGIAITPGDACGAGYEQWIRVIAATPRPILKQALDQITAAIS